MKAWSGTQPPAAATQSMVTAPAAVPGSLGCGRCCCGTIKQPVSTINCSWLSRWSTPPGWPRQPQHGVWSYDQMPRYRVNDAPSLTRSRSVAHPSGRRSTVVYVIKVCAIETWFRLRRPQSPTLHVCACLCVTFVPRPVSVQCTVAWTAGDGCSRETAGGRLPSCPTLITRCGNQQTMNVSVCKFAETRLTVKRQRYPIVG